MYLWYFVPIKGSPAYSTLLVDGEILGDEDNRTGHTVAFVPNGLTKEDLEVAYKRIYRAFYLRPSSVWTVIKSYGFSESPDLIVNGLKFISRFILAPLRSQVNIPRNAFR